MKSESLPRFFILSILVLSVVVFLSYANSLHTPFQSDDERHILINPHIDDLKYYTEWPRIRYRHATFLSFTMNHRWGGLDPWVYHFSNTVLHLLTSCMVLLVSFVTIARGTDWGRDAACTIAALTALLFAINPMQTEAVTYISGRPNSLAALFYLLALFLFILGSLKKTPFSLPRLMFYLLSLGAGMASVLSKEISFTLPILVALYDFCFMKGEGWNRLRERILCYYLAYPLVVLAYLARSPDSLWLFKEWFKKLSLGYGIIQAKIVSLPIKLFLLPVNQSFVYDFETRFAFWPWVFSLSVLGALIYLGMKKFYLKSALLSFGVFWYFLTLAPSNSFLPRTELLSERNLYLPSYGTCLFFAVWFYLTFLKGRLEHPARYRLAVGCLVLVFFFQAVLTVKRNAVYQSESTLWTDAFEKAPHKLNVGKTLSINYIMEGNYGGALVVLKQMLVEAPGMYDAHVNLSHVYKNLGDGVKAEAELLEAIRLKPDLPEAHYNLANLYAEGGSYIKSLKEYARAAEIYNVLAYKRPAAFLKDKAIAHNRAGIMYVKEEKFQDAIRELEQAAALDPSMLDAKFNLGKLYLDVFGNKAKAGEYLRQVLSLNPSPEQSAMIRQLLEGEAP